MSRLSDLALEHLAKNPPVAGSIEEVVLQLAREVQALELNAVQAAQMRAAYATAQQDYSQRNAYGFMNDPLGAQQAWNAQQGWYKDMFRGSAQQTARPARPMSGWRSELGITSPSPSKAEINAAYRQKAKMAHPDQGGSTEAMAALNAARAQALKETA